MHFQFPFHPVPYSNLLSYIALLPSGPSPQSPSKSSLSSLVAASVGPIVDYIVDCTVGSIVGSIFNVSETIFYRSILRSYRFTCSHPHRPSPFPGLPHYPCQFPRLPTHSALFNGTRDRPYS